MNKVIVLLSFISLLLCSACNQTQNSKPKNDPHETIPEQHPKKSNAHWSYNGETSPEHWVEIEKNADCGGKRQSPINIIDINTVATTTIQNPLEFHYSPTTILNDVKNNGHSIQFDFELGDSISYHKETYHLAQLHFHEPSEHTVNGVRYPLEIHLVHKSNTHNFTVVSVFAQEGDESQLFEFLESFLPIKEGASKKIEQAIDLTSLCPENNDFYTYSGSLTTPPCTENVNWIIYKQPIIISVDEVLKLKKNMPINNYRNEQPLNNRVVKSVHDTGNSAQSGFKKSLIK